MNKIMKNRRGMSLTDAPAAVLAVVLLFIFIAVGALIGVKFQEVVVGIDSNVSHAGYTSISNGLEALDTLGQFLPIVGVVIAAAIIIGLVVGAFYMRGKESSL